MRRPNACPRCGKNDQVVPIIYGMPPAELGEAQERGELKLGGCTVTDDQPELFCKRDELAF